jgi:tyrosine-protein kinase Etk/Wzc
MSDFNNISNFSENKTFEEEEGLNFKYLLGKALAFWPYLLLSVLVSMSIAFLVIRYSTPRYLVKTSILIKDNSRGRGSLNGADNFLQGM